MIPTAVGTNKVKLLAMALSCTAGFPAVAVADDYAVMCQTMTEGRNADGTQTSPYNCAQAVRECVKGQDPNEGAVRACLRKGGYRLVGDPPPPPTSTISEDIPARWVGAWQTSSVSEFAVGISVDRTTISGNGWTCTVKEFVAEKDSGTVSVSCKVAENSSSDSPHPNGKIELMGGGDGSVGVKFDDAHSTYLTMYRLSKSPQPDWTGSWVTDDGVDYDVSTTGITIASEDGCSALKVLPDAKGPGVTMYAFCGEAGDDEDGKKVPELSTLHLQRRGDSLLVGWGGGQAPMKLKPAPIEASAPSETAEACSERRIMAVAHSGFDVNEKAAKAIREMCESEAAAPHP